MIRSPVLLVGMMLSGKSTVGPLLAQRLSVPFVDLDALIEARSGRSIPEWFAGEGEAAFRAFEAATLASLLAEEEPRVVATGGGAFESPDSRALALERSVVVYLQGDPHTLAKRMAPSDDRPLLLAGPSPADVLAELLAAREANYRQAHVVVSVDGQSPEAIASSIAASVERRQHEAGSA